MRRSHLISWLLSFQSDACSGCASWQTSCSSWTLDHILKWDKATVDWRKYFTLLSLTLHAHVSLERRLLETIAMILPALVVSGVILTLGHSDLTENCLKWAEYLLLEDGGRNKCQETHSRGYKEHKDIMFRTGSSVPCVSFLLPTRSAWFSW